MSDQADDRSALIAWAVAERAVSGAEISGDQYLVKPFTDGVLVAVVDGLGHGEEAALAAKVAVSVLDRYAQEPLPVLVSRCHQELLRTRGVVMSLASYSARDGTMTWLGVGNVGGVLLPAGAENSQSRRRLMSGRGIVGYQLPALPTEVLPVTQGDMLIFATDGIRGEFTEALGTIGSLEQIAEQILAEYGKESDDAMILVARHLGRG